MPLIKTDETKILDRRIGERLRVVRISRGLTQHELAAYIGVTYQQMHKYEKARNRISASRLHILCRALDVSHSEIFDFLDDDDVTVNAYYQEPHRGLLNLSQKITQIEDKTMRTQLIRIFTEICESFMWNR